MICRAPPMMTVTASFGSLVCCPMPNVYNNLQLRSQCSSIESAAFDSDLCKPSLPKCTLPCSLLN